MHLYTSHLMCPAHPYEVVQAAEALRQFGTLLLTGLHLLTFAYILCHIIVETPAPPKSSSALPPAPPYRDPSPPHAWGGEEEPVFYTDDIPQ
jgi:hypothetical protein